MGNQRGTRHEPRPFHPWQNLVRGHFVIPELYGEVLLRTHCYCSTKKSEKERKMAFCGRHRARRFVATQGHRGSLRHAKSLGRCGLPVLSPGGSLRAIACLSGMPFRDCSSCEGAGMLGVVGTRPSEYAVKRSALPKYHPTTTAAVCGCNSNLYCP